MESYDVGLHYRRHWAGAIHAVSFDKYEKVSANISDFQILYFLNLMMCALSVDIRELAAEISLQEYEWETTGNEWNENGRKVSSSS